MGFVPWGGLKEVRPHLSEAYSATRIFTHDLLAADADGYVDPAAAQSVYIIGSALTPLTSSDSAVKEILVACDPLQYFIAQADETDFDEQARIFSTADHVNNTGNTYNYMSKQEIDSDTLAEGAVGGVLLHQLAPLPDNAWGAYCKMIVTICEHQFSEYGTQYV